MPSVHMSTSSNSELSLSAAEVIGLVSTHRLPLPFPQLMELRHTQKSITVGRWFNTHELFPDGERDQISFIKRRNGAVQMMILREETVMLEGRFAVEKGCKVVRGMVARTEGLRGGSMIRDACVCPTGILGFGKSSKLLLQSLPLITLSLLAHHLPFLQSHYRPDPLAQHPNHRSTTHSPQVNAHASQGRARKTQHPLDLIRDPSFGKPEHGRTAKVEVAKELEALGAHPAGSGDGAHEEGFEAFYVSG